MEKALATLDEAKKRAAAEEAAERSGWYLIPAERAGWGIPEDFGYDTGTIFEGARLAGFGLSVALAVQAPNDPDGFDTVVWRANCYVPRLDLAAGRIERDNEREAWNQDAATAAAMVVLATARDCGRLPPRRNINP